MPDTTGDDRIVWKEEFKRRCARRLATAELDAALSAETPPAGLLLKIKAHYDRTTEGWTLREQIDDGASRTSPALRELATRVTASYGSGKLPSNVDAELDAAAALFGPPAELIALWLADGGVVRLAKIAAHMATMRTHQERARSVATYLLPSSEVLPHSVCLVAHAIRERGSRMTAEERVEVRRILETARAGASLNARLQFALAADERSWAEQDARSFLAAPVVFQNSLPFLFTLVRDPSLCGQLAEKCGAVAAFDLTQHLGWGALPSVIRIFEKDFNVMAAEALSMFESPTAAKALATALTKKATAPIAKEYFERRPDLAVSSRGDVVDAVARYELRDSSSSKFWQIELSDAGTSFTTTYGRIGTRGQSSTKTFKTAAKAKLESDKLVAEKLKKGYRPVSTAPERSSTRAAIPLRLGETAPLSDLLTDEEAFLDGLGGDLVAVLPAHPELVSLPGRAVAIVIYATDDATFEGRFVEKHELKNPTVGFVIQEERDDADLLIGGPRYVEADPDRLEQTAPSHGEQEQDERFSGSKLGGFPHFIQCADDDSSDWCFVAQLTDPEYPFGDCGAIHVFMTDGPKPRIVVDAQSH